MNNKLIILGFVALTGLVLFMSSSESTNNNKVDADLGEFHSFRTEHGKVYPTEAEANHRLIIFKQNLAMIRKHNADKTSSYKLGVNQFSDMTFEEFSAYYLHEDPEDNFKEGDDINELAQVDRSMGEDDEIDWRKQGIVGAVKNQANCGSCWAFSAVSVVEEAFALQKKDISILAEQELVDCSGKWGNEGCNGGFSFQGLSYIKDKGVNFEKDYPYTARDGKCKPIAGKGVHKIAKWTAVAGGFKNMQDRLKISPTTASFAVQNDFFQYKSGIYNPKSCPGNRNHAVNAVGFDFKHEIPHFIVRNSWGAKFGEAGYFRISATGGNGTCWFNGEGRTTFVDLA